MSGHKGVIQHVHSRRQGVPECLGRVPHVEVPPPIHIDIVPAPDPRVWLAFLDDRPEGLLQGEFLLVLVARAKHDAQPVRAILGVRLPVSSSLLRVERGDWCRQMKASVEVKRFSVFRGSAGRSRQHSTCQSKVHTMPEHIMPEHIGGCTLVQAACTMYDGAYLNIQWLDTPRTQSM